MFVDPVFKPATVMSEPDNETDATDGVVFVGAERVPIFGTVL